MLLITILIFSSLLSPVKAMAIDTQNRKQISESIAPLSKEMVLQSYIGTITLAYTTKPLLDHYGIKLPYQLEDVKVIDAKLIYGINNVDFIFKTQVQPFVGAHDPVGIDEFTFRIHNSEIKLLKYEHIKSFPIPPFVKSHYKNLKPNY
ncbi:DUF3888 domain-containing protein [Clostridium estertheticum]|uniref:DUF3888 domain-containing protein n=1 Tax=Clostridium estertheticum TaxID=238834 RepID=UPI001CF0EA98|nr:DUF3888 domain-containing protein [Clostridium estertheticum]MCB2357243.1 DUF3888 domain-containing protein [Clostridium estertheticum]WAG43988.1 DUF3888 domain-containing protein [Clostridium estertheticum]